ncbi:Kynurenine 3-monooxygenase [Elsinoe australis]|uniref:Kynurenine 3-monooxygenase n=1 Tax=Elsinoe australis TaxID=40998 RepID=A0A2P8ADV5_9PEZI|nr:Kynurenine 3-monooxygenase [Elsinoe australis]
MREHHAPYPSNSLQFLRNQSPSPKISLKVVVVGAGLGGLATAIALARSGHRVEVLEQASKLGEVGAGIQVPPNSLRILQSWGIDSFLTQHVVEPHSITFRRWQDGEPIALTPLTPDFRERYDAPYYVVHRADLHHALHQLALKHGVLVRTKCRVREYHETLPEITLTSDEVVRTDLIVAADGIKSVARQVLDPFHAPKPMATGFAAYRATVPVDAMEEDAQTAWMRDSPSLNLWIGPGQHVMTYTIAAGKTFNLVLSHKDSTDPSNWSSLSQKQTIESMREAFEKWDPRLIRVIDKIESAAKWPLMKVPTIRKWVSRSGHLVVLGDAAHAMLPYMSQGAAMAVEDAAALGEAMADLQKHDDLIRRLSVFEEVRRLRAAQMQDASDINGILWHFDDGPEQVARDAAARREVLGQPFESSSNQWSDPVTQRWTYGYDAVWEMQKALGTIIVVDRQEFC